MNPTKAVCCKQFTDALEYGTDGYSYGAAIEWAHNNWRIGNRLPPILYCPWCGVGLPTIDPRPDPRDDPEHLNDEPRRAGGDV